MACFDNIDIFRQLGENQIQISHLFTINSDLTFLFVCNQDPDLKSRSGSGLIKQDLTEWHHNLTAE